MSRYIESYVTHFHKHYPIMHLPTYCPESSPIWLTLAIAAVGAQYRRESKNGHPLYEAARALALDHKKNELAGESDRVRTAMVQTLTLLMVYGAWDWRTDFLSGALDLQSTLFEYIRSSVRDKLSRSDDHLDWKTWIHAETHRRAILIAYAYLVIQSMAYDLPPVVLCSEVQDLCLPCSSAVWEARNEPDWSDALRQSKTTTVRAIDALHQLLGQSNGNKETTLCFSAIGSFIVLQALIQRISFTRELYSTSSTALPATELNVLQ